MDCSNYKEMPATQEMSTHVEIDESEYKTKIINTNFQSDTEDLDKVSDIRHFRCRFKKSLIFAHLNINSYRYKFLELKPLLSENLIDILFIPINI